MNEIVFDSNPEVREQQKEILASSVAIFIEGVRHLMQGNAEFDVSFLKIGFLKDTNIETLAMLTALCSITILPQLQNSKSEKIVLDKHSITAYVQGCILAETLVYYKDNVVYLMENDTKRQLKESILYGLATKIGQLSFSFEEKDPEESYEEFWKSCKAIMEARQRENERKKIWRWLLRFLRRDT